MWKLFLSETRQFPVRGIPLNSQIMWRREHPKSSQGPGRGHQFSYGVWIEKGSWKMARNYGLIESNLVLEEKEFKNLLKRISEEEVEKMKGSWQA